MPTGTPTNQLNLFLSSTVKDLHAYRRDVQKACLGEAETLCSLSEENWLGGYGATVKTCERRVRECDAFVVILGYWYGFVPSDASRSITHIEFDVAKTRWLGVDEPPMAALRPALGSVADKFMRGQARRLVPREKSDLKRHNESLDAFHAAVTDGRIVKQFKTKVELRQHVIVWCAWWKGRTFEAAARGEIASRPAPAVARVTDEELGAIGRDAQTVVVKSAIAKLADRPDVPAIALFIDGDDEAGQRVFAQRLVATVFKKYSPRGRRIARPVVRINDPAALALWVGSSLGIADLTGVQTPQDLAAKVASELRRQPMYFGFDRIGELSGGVTAFRDGFWVPFYTELSQLRASQQLTHRLVAIVTDYSTEPSPALAGAIATPDALGAIADYARLLRVPRLEPIERAQLLSWFVDEEIPDEPAGRRRELADRALKDSRGKTDPSPLRVFERLRGEILWPERENSNE